MGNSKSTTKRNASHILSIPLSKILDKALFLIFWLKNLAGIWSAAKRKCELQAYRLVLMTAMHVSHKYLYWYLARKTSTECPMSECKNVDQWRRFPSQMRRMAMVRVLDVLHSLFDKQMVCSGTEYIDEAQYRCCRMSWALRMWAMKQ